MRIRLVRNKSPFTKERLNEIFKVSVSQSDRIVSRECGWIEFKESFGVRSIAKYLRSCAAFANTKGGYIVFGITNSPHALKGLTENALSAFENLDPELLSQHFNEHFAPEIKWDIHRHEFKGKVFGVLYAYESQNKPVICIKNADPELRESDIYYRYRGRTQRVKYAELRSIIDERRQQEQQQWLRHIANIARIGVSEAGIFDLRTGHITGPGGRFIIDESLLSQLAFIKEGEFSEVSGKPTLKLIGKLEAIGPSIINGANRQTIRSKGIRIGDIVLGFLNNEAIPNPLEYVKQICYEDTAFLPVYCYIKKAKLSSAQTVEVLENLMCRSASKHKLIERIINSKTQYVALPKGENIIAIEKQNYASDICAARIDDSIKDKELIHCLQAIRGLSKIEIQRHSKYIQRLLKTWFNKYYATAQGNIADNLRRTICWVDEALYKQE